MTADAGHTVAALLKSGYAETAVAAYREHWERTAPSWLEGKGTRWSQAATAEALVWWIQNELNLTRDEPRITGRDGKSYPRGGHIDYDRRAQTAYTMRENGLTMREIATQLGCSLGTVHAILKPPSD